jgi:hypothetical protein
VFLDSGFVLRNTADNAAGMVRFALTQLSPSTPKSGSGNLIVVRLRGRQISAGSPLTVTQADLAQPDGTLMPVTMGTGTVAVVAAGSAPTATAVPTQPAGTSLPTGTLTEPATGGAPPTATSPATADTHILVATATATLTSASPTPLPTLTARAAASPTNTLPSTPIGLTATAAEVQPPTATATPAEIAMAGGDLTASPFPTFSPTLPAPTSEPGTGRLPMFGLALIGLALAVLAGAGAIIILRRVG